MHVTLGSRTGRASLGDSGKPVSKPPGPKKAAAAFQSKAHIASRNVLPLQKPLLRPCCPGRSTARAPRSWAEARRRRGEGKGLSASPSLKLPNQTCHLHHPGCPTMQAGRSCPGSPAGPLYLQHAGSAAQSIKDGSLCRHVALQPKAESREGRCPGSLQTRWAGWEHDSFPNGSGMAEGRVESCKKGASGQLQTIGASGRVWADLLVMGHES